MGRTAHLAAQRVPSFDTHPTIGFTQYQRFACLYADDDPEQASDYQMISTIRVDPARIDGYHLFRIARWMLALLVSESVKTALADVPELGVRIDSVV